VWACEDIKSVWAKHEQREDIFLPLTNFWGTIMLQAFETHTSPPTEVELKFQMQAMTQIMERMNFVMGNVCDRLDSMEKRGNEAGISTQDEVSRNLEPKVNKVQLS
jgi:hypothetical protein